MRITGRNKNHNTNNGFASNLRIMESVSFRTAVVALVVLAALVLITEGTVPVHPHNVPGQDNDGDIPIFVEYHR
jgi:hypothetical protein